MSSKPDVTVENISSEKKGDSFLTHWKFNKKVPMQFTMVDPSSIKSSYGKKPPKQPVNTQNVQQQQQQVQTQQPIQFINQQTCKQSMPDYNNNNYILNQRRNSAPVVTIDENPRQTVFQQYYPSKTQQQPQHAQPPPQEQFIEYTQQPIPQQPPNYQFPSVRTSRKRSIHDVNETQPADVHAAWFSSPFNKKNKHHGAKWRERMENNGDQEDSEVYGSDYVSTLTPEQQAYIRGGRSRSVPAHVLSEQLKQFQPQQPSPNMPQYSQGLGLNYTSSPRSPNNSSGLPPILPSISELQHQVDQLNHRRGSIDELSINFSARATMGDQSIASLMRNDQTMNADTTDEVVMEDSVQNDDDMLNNEDMERRIRRRVSYTEEMNTLELLKERRRGSQPNPLDVAKHQQLYQNYRPSQQLQVNDQKYITHSPTVNIASYTFPLKPFTAQEPPTKEPTSNRRRTSVKNVDDETDSAGNSGNEMTERTSSNTPLNASDLVLPPILGFEANNPPIPPVLPSMVRRPGKLNDNHLNETNVQ
jgi:hypothetical protein